MIALEPDNYTPIRDWVKSVNLNILIFRKTQNFMIMVYELVMLILSLLIDIGKIHLIV